MFSFLPPSPANPPHLISTQMVQQDIQSLNARVIFLNFVPGLLCFPWVEEGSPVLSAPTSVDTSQG